MKLIHDYNKLIFYTITFLMLIGISVLLLVLIYSSFNYQINIKILEPYHQYGTLTLGKIVIQYLGIYNDIIILSHPSLFV